jgi:hypothetical protein
MPDDEGEVENTAFSAPRPLMQDDDDGDEDDMVDGDEYVDEVVVSVAVYIVIRNTTIVILVRKLTLMTWMRLMHSCPKMQANVKHLQI